EAVLLLAELVCREDTLVNGFHVSRCRSGRQDLWGQVSRPARSRTALAPASSVSSIRSVAAGLADRRPCPRGCWWAGVGASAAPALALRASASMPDYPRPSSEPRLAYQGYAACRCWPAGV